MILISGASRGIGKYLIEYYIHKDKVIGFYNKTKPDNLIHVMQKLDISSHIDIQNFINKSKDQLEHIVLINCAGINYNSFAHKANPTDWAKVININLVGTFNLINAILPIMREQNYGRIINLSSVVAQKGILGTSAYAASKSALWGLTKAISVENASKGITINNINLGYFNIGMINNVPDYIKVQILEQIPVKHFGRPEDIVKTINFIIETPYLTGSNIDLNGGLL